MSESDNVDTAAEIVEGILRLPPPQLAAQIQSARAAARFAHLTEAIAALEALRVILADVSLSTPQSVAGPVNMGYRRG
jgi:hypothetical protein